MCFEDFPMQHQLSVPAGMPRTSGWTVLLSRRSVDGPGVFSVVVANELGCTTERIVTVIDFCSEPLLFIPTAFTPDGDGLNELWKGATC